jgi:hypothetical protein
MSAYVVATSCVTMLRILWGTPTSSDDVSAAPANYLRAMSHAYGDVDRRGEAFERRPIDVFVLLTGLFDVRARRLENSLREKSLKLFAARPDHSAALERTSSTKAFQTKVEHVAGGTHK